MSEAAFQVIHTVVLLMEIVLYAFCFSYFIGRLYYRRAERSKGTIMVFLLYVIFYLLKMTILTVPAWVGLSVIFFIIAAESAVRGYRRIELLAFMIVTWFCIQNLSVLIINSIYTVVTDEFVAGLTELNMIYQRTILIHSISAIIRTVLLYFMIGMIIRHMDKRVVDIHGKEAVWLLIIPVAGIHFGNIIMHILVVVKEETYFILYEQFPAFIWIIPMVATLFYLGILFSISTYSSMLELQEERNKEFTREQQVIALKNRMEEVEQFYDTAKRMKHEMRNHATMIKGLAAKGAYDEIDTYIEKIDQGAEGFEFSIKTGNAVTDVIINDFKKKAEKAGIEYEAAFDFEHAMGIELYDMGIVLNNLLGNALEACERLEGGKKQIQIAGRRKRKFFLLNVKNTYSGVIELNEKTGFPVSTKNDAGSLHGIGLENVSMVADKYLGSMDIKLVKNMFCVTVVLQEAGGIL